MRNWRTFISFMEFHFNALHKICFWVWLQTIQLMLELGFKLLLLNELLRSFNMQGRLFGVFFSLQRICYTANALFFPFLFSFSIFSMSVSLLFSMLVSPLSSFTLSLTHAIAIRFYCSIPTFYMMQPTSICLFVYFLLLVQVHFSIEFISVYLLFHSPFSFTVHTLAVYISMCN